MAVDVEKEVAKIASEAESASTGIKLKDKRVGKSDFVKAAEKFLEVDISEIKKRAKQDAKKKALRAVGEILSGLINLTFNSPSTKPQSSGSVIRQGDNVSYVAYNQMSGNVQSPVNKSNRLTFPDLVYDTWDDANDLKVAAEAELIRNGGQLSVSKFYDIFGDVAHLEMTDSMIGWRDLSSAWIGMEDGKYRLYMPQVESLR